MVSTARRAQVCGIRPGVVPQRGMRTARGCGDGGEDSEGEDDDENDEEDADDGDEDDVFAYQH